MPKKDPNAPKRPRGNPNWIKGKPQPSGDHRPRVYAEFNILVRDETQGGLYLIEKAKTLIEDKQAPASVRLEALRFLADRGYGKPQSTVELKGSVTHSHAHAAFDFTKLSPEAMAGLDALFQLEGDQTSGSLPQAPVLDVDSSEAILELPAESQDQVDHGVPELTPDQGAE